MLGAQHRIARVPIESFHGKRPRVHRRAFVHPGAHLIGEVEIGEEASVWPAAVLRGDHGSISIGPRTSVQDGCVAHATQDQSHTSVGAECTIGHRVVLHGCIVADRCLVGMGSVLLDNVELGEWCFVGAATLLTPQRSFPPRSFIIGSPGRRVREVTPQEMEWIEHSWKSYRDLVRRRRA
jgi:carbonic anhydrase/acetyltransferase-like protein (isoleucine patch superfamily)